MSRSNFRKQQNKSKLQAIFDKGKKLVSNSFIAFFLLSDSKDVPDLTIIVTKKIGNAVKRNCSKRRLREMVRLHINLKASSIKLILLARSSTAHIKHDQLMKDCNNLVSRISNILPL